MQAKFESLKNKTVRLSILEDALLAITTVQSFHNYDELKFIIPQLGAQERAIRAGKEGAVESNEDIKDIWYAIVSCHIVDRLEGKMYAVEQMFSRAGFKP